MQYCRGEAAGRAGQGQSQRRTTEVEEYEKGPTECMEQGRDWGVRATAVKVQGGAELTHCRRPKVCI